MKKLLLIAVLSFIVSMPQISGAAIITPEVSVTNLKLANTDVKSGEIISGSFTIINRENFIVSDFFWTINLILYPTEGKPLLIDEYDNQENLIISPKAVINQSFSYKIPAGLSGAYTLRVMLLQKTGSPLSWQNIEIKIEGEEGFILIKNDVMVKDGEEFQSGAGTRYPTEKNPKVKFIIENKTNKPISAIPVIDIYRRDKALGILKSYKEKSLSLNSLERRSLIYDLPLMKEPNVYVAEIYFVNENNAKISNAILPRWIISGLNADILAVESDKSSLKKGEEINLRITFVGPADDEYIGGKADISAEISCEGEIVGSTILKEVNLDESMVLPATIKAEKDANCIRVAAKILKDNKVLSEYNAAFGQVEKEELPPPQKTISPKYYLYLFIFSGIAILALIIYLIQRFKKTNNLTISVLILFFAAASFFLLKTEIVSAETVGVSGDMQLTWNEPSSDSYFQAGEEVKVSGLFRIPECGNILGGNAYYNIYLTDSNGNNKVNLLSEGKLIDQWGWSEFSAIVKIPNNLSYKGSARIYIYGQGQHMTAGDQHFHNITAYRIINITEPTLYISGNTYIARGNIYQYYAYYDSDSQSGPNLAINVTNEVSTLWDSSDLLIAYLLDETPGKKGRLFANDIGKITLTASFSNLTAKKNVEVVEEPIILFFDAVQQIVIFPSQTTILKWEAKNVTSCGGTSDPSNSQWDGENYSISGEKKITNISQNTMFTLSCVSGELAVSRSVTVKVLGLKFQEIKP